MKKLARLGSGLLLVLFVGPTASADRPADPSALEVEGRTQVVPGRRAVLAPVPQHPIEEVLVAPGDRVKKDQVLIKMDADEPEADVRNKKALLEGAIITRQEARRALEVAEQARDTLPERRLHEARMAALKADADERAAKAALDAAEAELEHYTMKAPFDGVVSWLEAPVGAVGRPGVTVWGEILDLREIDVRCEVTPDLVDRVTVGQAAEVRVKWRKDPVGTGKVVLVGAAADKSTGGVPVVVRLDNAAAALRCNVPVQVRLKLAAPE